MKTLNCDLSDETEKWSQ